MKAPVTRRSLRHLLVVLLLVAGQSVAFAHGVDEASHPAKTVCDLCIAGHSLGTAAGDSAATVVNVAPGRVGVTPDSLPHFAPTPWFSPGPRAPPVSR